MHRLVLIRHGQSDWNRRNLFTGWTDVPLTEAGLAESHSAAVALKAAGFDLDVAFTSVLTRAIVTLHTVLADMDRLWLPVHKHWRLNERHYGALQGLDKRQTAERHGDAMVALWRRSWDVPPPSVDPADLRSALDDRRYAGLAADQRPRGESLKDTSVRVLPYWTESIVPALRLGARVVVAAHGNSLRALVKHLDRVPDDVIPQVEIPTGRPLVYELDAGLAPLRRYFLHASGAAEPVEWRRG